MGAKWKSYRSLSERFWKKVAKAEGCWEWVGAKKPPGYGHISVGNGSLKTQQAHRVSWEMHNGPIPPGMSVCHRCDNPGCVNPEHLFLGSHRENMHDSVSKGRARCVSAETNRQKIACLRGHPFTPENTHVYLGRNGRPCRGCRTCRLNQSRKRFRKWQQAEA